MAFAGQQHFDYIVVGAGSSGCVLVGELVAALPNASIALVECGRDHSGEKHVTTPSLWTQAVGTSADYGYTTVPQKAFGMRKIRYPRGRGLGGSSLINAMIYSRGFKADWDSMPTGWRANDVEPHFVAIEERLALTTAKRLPLGDDLQNAAAKLGFDDAGADRWTAHGCNVQHATATIDSSGKRVDLYRVFGADNKNVEVVCARGERILIDEHKRTTGVLVRCENGSLRTLPLAVSGELILCAGAVDTPKLLQLSGIGPSELLARLEIPEVCALPVGMGLKDHPIAFINFKLSEQCKAQPSRNAVLGWINDERRGVQFLLLHAKYETTAGLVGPALKDPHRKPGGKESLMFCFMSCVATVLSSLIMNVAKVQTTVEQTAGILFAVTRPRSVGTVTITSTDPAQPPAIDPNFFSDEEDRKSMLEALTKARELAGTAPLASTLVEEDVPGKSTSGEVYLFNSTSAYWHPTGTCRIGDCVDEELRVHGVSGLRVADASVLTVHPRVPTAAACMMVGHRCASLLVRSRGKQAVK